MAKKAPPATAGKTEAAGAQPAAAPIRPPKKTEINLRVEFTRDEIVELALIEAAKRDALTAAQAKQSEERLAVRKGTPGTAEVPSDEGSRDDAGDETKND